MVRLIITPEIINKTSWGKTSKLVNTTRSMRQIEILYAPTLDAQTTAQGLAERIIKLEDRGLESKINVREAKFLSKGNKEIIDYLKSEADIEVQNYISHYERGTPKLEALNLILVLKQKVSETLPSEIWKNMLKAKFGGVPELKEGQAIFFHFKKSYAKRAIDVYSKYSYTALF